MIMIIMILLRACSSKPLIRQVTPSTEYKATEVMSKHGKNKVKSDRTLVSGGFLG